VVSVIIPTYNRAFCLNKAVNSVLGQKGIDTELIVVDDGSTDETEEILRPLADRGRLILISQPNRGVAAARNAGIKRATGDYVAFLDSDDEYLPGKLEAQVRDMTARPQFLVSQCREIWFRSGVRVNPGRKHEKKQGFIFSESVRLCLISPSAVIIRPEIFNEIGFFDEDLLACEDYDLWLRLTCRFPIGLLERDLVIRHGGRDDQLSGRWGLDLYRIKALKKIICSGLLNSSQAEAAAGEMARRRRIYESGCFKRGMTAPEY
jgi:glycosyltransferase involved in cell wall biosynthesis